VSKQAGWIAPVVLAGGVAHGTWEMAGDRLASRGSGKPARRHGQALQSEAARLGAILSRELDLVVHQV